MKHAHYLALAAILLIPSAAFAATSLNLEPITGIFKSLLDIVDQVIIPAIFAIAFLVFIWGIYKYFIQGGANEEDRKKGRDLMLWGVIGFFVMISVWGLVNILVGTFNFGENNKRPGLPLFNQSGSSSTGSSSSGPIGPQP